jgi:hypothetical protein
MIVLPYRIFNRAVVSVLAFVRNEVLRSFDDCFEDADELFLTVDVGCRWDCDSVVCHDEWLIRSKSQIGLCR